LMTLAYLAVQVRQNTRAMQSSTFQDVTDGMNQVSHAIATHTELATLVTKGSEGQVHLSPRSAFGITFFLSWHFVASKRCIYNLRWVR
jgi:hypothetical protein